MNLINDFLKTKRELNYHIDMLYRAFFQQSRIISFQAEKIHNLEIEVKKLKEDLAKLECKTNECPLEDAK